MLLCVKSLLSEHKKALCITDLLSIYVPIVSIEVDSLLYPRIHDVARFCAVSIRRSTDLFGVQRALVCRRYVNLVKHLR